MNKLILCFLLIGCSGNTECAQWSKKKVWTPEYNVALDTFTFSTEVVDVCESTNLRIPDRWRKNAKKERIK